MNASGLTRQPYQLTSQPLLADSTAPNSERIISLGQATPPLESIAGYLPQHLNKVDENFCSSITNFTFMLLTSSTDGPRDPIQKPQQM